MSRSYSYINSAKTIISSYKGELPFNAFLKGFFSKEKKYGSRDRRIISSLCYNYFRLGNAFADKSIEEQLFTGLFLNSEEPSEILQSEKPEWIAKATLPLSDKVLVSGIDLQKIFPYNDELSKNIDKISFNKSFLIQPKLFVRIRPGKQGTVREKLKAARISFEEINEYCLAFANGTRLEEVIKINQEAVVQDLNSQRVSELLTTENMSSPENVWDCCAASGGKSIMAYDMFSNIKLTVSDVRQSIIQNLHKRFREAGIKNYESFIVDLTSSRKLQDVLHDKKYDLIICDAPCSGSGTWSRTPEQLKFFDEKEITRYSNLQRSICKNTIPFIKKGGYFLYITCSVFESENEKVVDFILQEFPIKLIKMEMFKGYEIKADTMFAALFRFS